MRILVLGATGYVGTKLIDHIICGNEVYCAVRSTSDIRNIRKAGAEIVPVESLNGLPSSLDVFVNLSCKYMGNSKCSNDIVESNLCVPLRVLSKCVDIGVRKVVTIGTGLPDNFNEYTYSKKMFSDYGRWLTHGRTELSFYNVKLETYYGPDEPAGRFIPSVIGKLKTGEPVKLTEGTQKRDIIHIDDVVCNLKRMILDIDELGYHDIPLGTGDSPTIREIIDYLKRACGSHSDLMYGAVPMRPGEPNSVADIEQMRKYGIEAKINWKDGLKSICEAKL